MQGKNKTLLTKKTEKCNMTIQKEKNSEKHIQMETVTKMKRNKKSVKVVCESGKRTRGKTEKGTKTHEKEGTRNEQIRE